MPDRALLLSGSLGMGHDVMAQACAGSLAARGWDTDTLDAMRLLGGKAGAIGEQVFRRLLAIPGVYDALHFSALRPGTRLALGMDAAARARILPRLRDALDDAPAQLVISVFATGASAAAALRRDGATWRHLVFCTDVTPHRMWVHDGTDCYLVTSHVAAAAVHRHDPYAAVVVVPAPVRAPFLDPPSAAAARAELGVPGDARCVLMMSGAWGIGPVADAARALADAGVHVLAVAGRNAALTARLEAVAAQQPLVHPFGFTDRVATLMAASDLVVTSSGDTCTEARVIGRPLLLLDVVPGHGRDNLQQELALGGAGVTSADAASVARSALAALDGGVTAPAPVPDPGGRWELAFGEVLERVGLGASTAA